jgi:hypothetical protein
MNMLWYLPADRAVRQRKWQIMSKATRTLAVAFAAMVLFGSPLALQAVDAAGMAPAKQELPKQSALDKATLDAAIKRTNMAFAKSQSDKAFIAAVKAKDSAAVKAILMKNGADAFISTVNFEGNGAGAARLKITVSGSCCPPTLIIVIRF